jgi:hypothetical protein
VDPTLIQEAPFLFVDQPALLMNVPLSWPRRLFLITVSLAAISPHVAVSLATSVVLLAFMAWDARQRRPAAAAAVNAATPTDVTGPGPPV